MRRKIYLLMMLLFLSIGHLKAQTGPIVSFTYDDGYPSWWDLGFPLYQQYGFPGVAYINATNSWVSASGTIAKLHKMQAAGWEISNHSYDHSGVTVSSVSDMKNWLDSNGFPNSGFCAPGHAWSHEMVNIVKNYHPYYSATYLNPYDTGISTEPLDLYYMKRFPLDNAVSINQVQAVLDDAVQNNKWVIFYGHPLGSTSGGWEQDTALLRATFDEVIARGIPVKTVREVINDLMPAGCVIECSVDSLQNPVLSYFEEGQGTFNTSVWNEYWHNTSYTDPRFLGSPVVYYHTSNDTLPVMKFFRNVPNGIYDVRASIIVKDPGRTYRLFYSLNDENNPSKDSVQITKNSDVSLGTVTVTNGQFELYTQKADAVTGGDGYVGWAFIRLITQSYANLKVFLQGSYAGSQTMTTSLNSAGMIPVHHPYNDTLDIWNYRGSERIYNLPSDVVDWVLVELRTGTAASTTVGKRAALLKSDGSIVDLDGSSQVKFKAVVPGNYYIVVRHRNHLPIMSSNPVTLGFSSSSLYDFSTAQTQAFGTEPMADLGDNVFGMYAGDANQDGFITSTDFNVFNPKFIGAASGYEDSDWNLDGSVTSTDFNLFNPNFISSRQSFVP